MSKTRQTSKRSPSPRPTWSGFTATLLRHLKRREGTYVFDEFGAGLRSVFLGGVPLVGLLWGTGRLSNAAFLLVGSWVGILCDFAKMWFLELEIRTWGEAFYEDWHVWIVVDALRVGATEAATTYLRANTNRGRVLFVDFLCGGIATMLICIGLVRSPAGVDWDELNDGSMLLWLAGVAFYNTLFTVWEILQHKSGQAAGRQVKVAVGMRGFGLFVFLFVMVGVTAGFEKTGPGVKWAMVVVNGAIVVWGLVTMLSPVLLLRRETLWLKDYLEKRQHDGRL